MWDQQLLEQLRDAQLPLDTIFTKDSVLATLHHKAAQAHEIFSSSSLAAPEPILVAEQGSRDIISWGIGVAALVVLLLYCLAIYRHSKAISASLKALFSIEDTFFIFENVSLEFKRFFGTARLMLILSIATIVVQHIAADNSSGRDYLLLICGVTLYIYVSIGLQNVFRLLVARFDTNVDRLGALRSFTLFDYAVISVIFCPISIVVSSINSLWGFAWTVLAILVIIHWGRLFIYFKCSGFSILQWILYLCTLEVLPFTILASVGLHFGIL